MMQSQKLSVIGTRPIRHDGVDKVIGRAQFASDMPFSDALECKILRSPFAHAKIKHIDISDASSLFGVHAVVTAADFPYQDAKVLATDKVLYKGHPIAAVAAVNSHVAQEAINLIKKGELDAQENPLRSRQNCFSHFAYGSLYKFSW